VSDPPLQRQLLAFSRCMLAHGIHNFPDPTSTGQITKPPGLDLNSPQVQAANKACQHYAPKGSHR
jgi:hypothetical protein